MRLLMAALGIACLAACGSHRAVDSIDRLVARMEDGKTIWLNGPYTPISLPADAELRAVVEAAIADYRKQGVVCAVLEVKDVEVRDGPAEKRIKCSAARVAIDSKERVVLFLYQGPKIGWWARVF